MLKPNTIPEKEPLLRVGIILPEDRFNSIELTLPDTLEYQFIPKEGNILHLDEQNYKFEKNSNTISLNKSKSSDSWRIEPGNSYHIGPKTGIRVKNVVAGRGFHWQKPIDVYLPGSIEIAVFNNHLILTNELPLEEYLMCVATSEMGSQCPEALIESQTIAARSWMLANIEQKHVDMGMDVCNDDCCQRYQGSGNLTSQSISGARNTYGQVLLYENQICDARYSKSCGGMMESFQTIWSGADPEYLKNIADAPEDFNHKSLPLRDEISVKNWIDDIPDTFCSSNRVNESNLKKYLGSVDEEGKYFRWQIDYSQVEICNLLNEKLDLFANAIIGFRPIRRGGSGRLCEIEVAYRDKDNGDRRFIIDSEYKIRQTFHKGFLYSSCFYITDRNPTDNIPEGFTLRGAGWGHGVGYCQIGALGMSLTGYSTEQIVSHYYPGSELEKIY